MLKYLGRHELVKPICCFSFKYFQDQQKFISVGMRQVTKPFWNLGASFITFSSEHRNKI